MQPAHRFIPTRVGNTLLVAAGRLFGTVHPHASGEHQIGVMFGLLLDGSSPREWGTLYALCR